MPLTQLDRNAALIVIDLQKGIAGTPMAHPAQQVIANAAQLTHAFRERGLPVVLVNVTGMAPGRTDTPRHNFTNLPPDFAELVPELDQQPGDILLSKQRPGAFLGTRLQEELQQRGVTQVFLAGISTSIGVESTARSAYDLGYNVVFVTDAMTDRNAESHDKRVEILFPRLGETETTENVVRVLRG
jgi:nicotinamidase-related amidase